MTSKIELDDIYFKTIIKKTINIPPENQNKNIRTEIERLVQKEFEGKCIEEGFVKENSLQVTKRSVLKLVPNTFNGTMYSEVRIKARICNPVRGNVVNCQVEKINKMGVLGNNPPLNIIIPRSFHPTKDAFKDIKIGDSIQVEVIGSRFENNWDHIDVIGRLYDPSTQNKSTKKTEIKIITTPGPKVDVLEEISDNSELDEVAVEEEDEEVDDDIINDEDDIINDDEEEDVIDDTSEQIGGDDEDDDNEISEDVESSSDGSSDGSSSDESSSDEEVVVDDVIDDDGGAVDNDYGDDEE